MTPTASAPPNSRLAGPGFRIVPAWLIRVAAFVGFVTAIAGMIVSSIDDADGRAIAFGLIGAGSALSLIAVTAVGGFSRAAGAAAASPPAGAGRAADDDVDRLGADVEAAVAGLTAAGADETVVRDLVRRAVELGRHLDR